MKKNMCYLFFRLWIILPSILISSSIYFPSVFMISFFLMAQVLWELSWKWDDWIGFFELFHFVSQVLQRTIKQRTAIKRHRIAPVKNFSLWVIREVQNEQARWHEVMAPWTWVVGTSMLLLSSLLSEGSAFIHPLCMWCVAEQRCFSWQAMLGLRYLRRFACCEELLRNENSVIKSRLWPWNLEKLKDRNIAEIPMASCHSCRTTRDKEDVDTHKLKGIGRMLLSDHITCDGPDDLC